MRIGSGPDRALGIGQSLGGVSGADQQRGVVNKDGGIVWLEAEGAFEVLFRLGDVAVFELEFPSDEVGGRAQHWVAFGFEAGENVGVDFAFLDDPGDQVALTGEAVGGSEGGEIRDVRSTGGGMTRHTAGIDMVHDRLGNCVGIVADVVFEVAAGFADVIGQNGAAIFQVNGVRPRTSEGRRHRYKEDGDTQPHSGAF